MLKLKTTGRGRRFSLRRGVAESVFRVVYAGGWPARLWGSLPGRTEVDVINHALAILPAGVTAGPRKRLRLAFASDLHIGPLTSPVLLDHAFARLAEARPDVLVLGGDYVYLEATEAKARELEARVSAVPAAVKLAVMGNHDLWTRHELIEAALARAGVRVLINDGVRLPAPWDDVAIVGLDDTWTGQPDPARTVAAAGDAALVLAVAHTPEAVPLLAGRGPKLLLCGHTHGGQVALPKGPVVVHGPHGRMYPSGLYQLGDMHLFVSRGLGSVELPMRMYARPDVAVFDIE